MMNGCYSFTKSYKMQGSLYSGVFNWIMKSWKKISPDWIKVDSSEMSDCEEHEDIIKGMLNSFVEFLNTL